ncbi:MAG: MFS transporter [Pseudomonadota bacterium]
MPTGVSPFVGTLFAAKALRAVGDGYVAVLLPVYLLHLGFDAVVVGTISTATLLGSALMTVGVGLIAHRYAQRSLLLLAAGLMVATGMGFALLDDLWPLIVVAFLGTLNPSSGDVSVFLPLEQALLAQAAPDRHRTALFARYSLIGSLFAAGGSLFAGLPEAVAGEGMIPMGTALKGMFALYGLLGVGAFLLYRRIPEVPHTDQLPRVPLGPSRKRVWRLAALFSLDAFAGGFIVQSLLALWLLERFGLSPGTAGVFFFWSGLLTAFSYLAAVPIAKRFGLVNTMVFTHLPANLFLIAAAMAPDFRIALVFLSLRAVLSQMDVPTRSSYVMAVVTPPERPAAASLTAVPRSLAAAVSPVLAGALMTVAGLGAPLVVCGVLKIAYDLMLLAGFRRVRPPEEIDA